MSTRNDIMAAIAEFVDDSACSGQPLDVNRAAFKLTSEYPQSGFHLREICEMILTTAEGNGAQIRNDRST